MVGRRPRERASASHQLLPAGPQRAADLGNSAEAANTLDRIGHTHVALGEHTPARLAWREALLLFEEQGRDTDVERTQQQLDALDQSLAIR
jgi:hypothetical protein